MAIDLFCYAIERPQAVQSAVNLMISQHKGLFTKRFVAYEVGEANEVQKKMAQEHGLIVNSEFMVSLNDKDSSDLIPTVLAIIKYSLGEGKVVILSNGGALRMI